MRSVYYHDSMTGFTKLFGSIVASTIWREDDKTRLVWITMLAISNKHGIVEASIPGLADLSRVSVEEARMAIAKLEAPDPDSRSKDAEGRRILPVDGGWMLVNHAKYRSKLNAEERQNYWREKQREHRTKQSTMSTNVNNCPAPSTMSTHTEAEADADPLNTSGKPVRDLKKSTIPNSTVIPEALDVPEFHLAWVAWLEHLKQKRKPATLHAQDLQLRKLAGMGLAKAISTINYCIEHNWQGIYEQQQSNGTTGSPDRNKRNEGTYEGVTDYAAAAKRKLERQMAGYKERGEL